MLRRLHDANRIDRSRASLDNSSTAAKTAAIGRFGSVAACQAGKRHPVTDRQGGPLPEVLGIATAETAILSILTPRGSRSRGRAARAPLAPVGWPILEFGARRAVASSKRLLEALDIAAKSAKGVSVRFTVDSELGEMHSEGTCQSEQRRFVLGDPSLVDFSGHCFEYIQAVRTELEARGIRTACMGNKAIQPQLAATTGALRTFTYWCDARPVPPGVDADSQLGRRYIRQAHEDQLGLDLVAADEDLHFKASDVLILNTFRHWPLRGLVDWLETLGIQRAPKVALLLHFTAYPSIEHDDGTADMYTDAFHRIEKSRLRDRFTLFADSEALVDEYREMTKIGVHLMPIPHAPRAEQALARFKRDNRIVIAYVGEARRNKGFHMLPHVVEGFHRAGLDEFAHFNIQSFIHNRSDSAYLRTMGRLETSNVTLFDKEMDGETYRDFLASADVVVLPYLLDNYYKQTSGIFSEAMSLEKIPIVSRGTWMAQEVKKYCSGELCIPEDHHDLFECTARVVVNYAEFQEKAIKAARQWKDFHSASNFVDVVLERINELPR